MAPPVTPYPVLSQALRGQHADAVIAELTALKKTPIQHKDMALTSRLRSRGTASLLAAGATSSHLP